ncbi:divalent-cation tolerance protein CutA [Pseudidiomarina sp.]|uniref:divalent-cation tolerance protein CutA n=1 Tax=Pseudidiomarina sp. TaxID=2081707 RepID=UPI003A97CD07
MSSEHRLVICSCPDKHVAKAIADKVLRARRAACVNISAPSTSMYWWDDHIHADEEVLLQIKTTASELDELFKLIQTAHPYDVPELIAVPITEGSAEYLGWIKQVTQS